jgi:hypothetical protein
MKILSTLGFATQLTNGTVLAAAEKGTPQPVVTDSGSVGNLPSPQDGTLYLVNARVFGATDRSDIVMFAHTLTQRDANGLVTAQGGYVTKNGEVVPF